MVFLMEYLKDIISNGNILKDEVYFENGQIMFDLSSGKRF